ncbi:TIGR01440 family protein [Salirhabdus sp. Marseille-P4669]|uniref:TIGR01440 family protein n=1 Tax=Salirhabdus sp. Marseille-P4669 TaxID=2042310 RepID=UPI000C7CB77F|nr:TIGR01440 family protein [Salirhabdus sp. Marseille-P4669]
MANIPLEDIQNDVDTIVSEWIDLGLLKRGELFVIGCSTSEVAGERIGTSGNKQIAKELFTSFRKLEEKTGVSLAFQCCEHLNRALVVSEDVLERFRLTEVSAIPVPGAGGSMAAYAFQQMQDAVLVESIQAHAGMDIGDTFIGMHLKPVVVPIRLRQKNIGAAHVTFARTRPKLIGGERAVYSKDQAKSMLCD